jgi:hypothetical protein
LESSPPQTIIIGAKDFQTDPALSSAYDGWLPKGKSDLTDITAQRHPIVGRWLSLLLTQSFWGSSWMGRYGSETLQAPKLFESVVTKWPAEVGDMEFDASRTYSARMIATNFGKEIKQTRNNLNPVALQYTQYTRGLEDVLIDMAARHQAWEVQRPWYRDSCELSRTERT